MPRPALTVGAPVENSRARYWPVAPDDKPLAVVTVRESNNGVLACLSCLYDRRCPHIRAVEDSIGAASKAA